MIFSVMQNCRSCIRCFTSTGYVENFSCINFIYVLTSITSEHITNPDRFSMATKLIIYDGIESIIIKGVSTRVSTTLQLLSGAPAPAAYQLHHLLSWHWTSLVTHVRFHSVTPLDQAHTFTQLFTPPFNEMSISWKTLHESN